MASIAIMIGGALLNAAAFSGGNYITKLLTGDDGKAVLAEKTRHNKAQEGYQEAMDKYTREREQLFDWVETNREIKAQADQNFTNTDYAFKLYNQAHPDYKLTQPTKPKISAKRAAETGRASFCRRRRASARIRSFLFSLNFCAP